MTRRICIVDGHPDPAPGHYDRAIVEAYADGARSVGHEVRITRIADLTFPVLRSPDDWQDGTVPGPLAAAQADLGWAEHVVIVYPLWLGSMPALLKAFLEQVLRPGFAVSKESRGLGSGLMKGRSARVIVTMGMPGPIYRFWFGAHSLKALERNLLAFCGFAPIRHSIVGSVEAMGEIGRKRWLERFAALGRAAA